MCQIRRKQPLLEISGETQHAEPRSTRSVNWPKFRRRLWRDPLSTVSLLAAIAGLIISLVAQVTSSRSAADANKTAQAALATATQANDIALRVRREPAVVQFRKTAMPSTFRILRYSVKR